MDYRDDEAAVRALEESMREAGRVLRRLTLALGLLAARLGDQLSDTRVLQRPTRLVPYRVQGLNQN